MLVISFDFLVLEHFAIMNYVRCLINGRSDGLFLKKIFQTVQTLMKVDGGDKIFPRQDIQQV